MKGNEALAEAAIRAGCKCFFGYPITPQTEVAAYLAKKLPKTGGQFVQAESEVAAINMVYGASAAGVRCMTSSSSPGISLKTEGISYLCGADLPCVIINVQRGGPGLGGIQPSQADYFQATRALGHGDSRVIVYAPNSVQEMVNVVNNAFNLADEYRMPAMILADGLLGQMMEPVEFPETETAEVKKPWATNGHGGSREHNIVNSLYLKPDVLEKSILERDKRYKDIEAKHTTAESFLCDDAELVIVAYGATARVCKSAVNASRAKGIKAGLFRPVTLWPYPKKELVAASSNAKTLLTVEMSTGQMIEDVKLAIECKKPVEFYGRTGGIIPTPAEVLAQIEKITKTLDMEGV
ncbi:MAG: 3-methyl-2-oxobutanoate dehydrogenase subunit VorB [Ruminococcus sp.]|jgi:2-oxoglutarate ferredoxin oxidoreductase subunit alpha|nr:3-methyl-2-oxobutanoate dehydrogenase subunit VorB [Ruminococcus sp.]